MKQSFSIRNILFALGVVLLALLASKGVLYLSALEDLKWEAKAVALSTLGFFLFFVLLFKYEKAKRYIPYILAILISQTGFAYEIKPGYYTSANEVLTVMIFLVWMARRILLRRQGIPPTYFSRELKIFIVVAMAGILTAYLIFQVEPLNIIIVFKSYILYLFYLFLIPDCIHSEKELRRVILFMLSLSIIPLFHGIIGSFSIEDLEVERLSLARWGALNIFVGYILPLFFIAFGFLLQKKPRWLQFLTLCYMGLILYLIFVAQTRTAWASLAFCTGLFIFLVRQKMSALVVAVILAAGIMLSPMGGEVETVVRYRITEQTLTPDSALQDRYSRWEGAWETAKAYPLTGSGWGGVLRVMGDGSVEGPAIPLLPLWHNSYLEILSQLGFPGLLAFLLLWGRLVKTEAEKLYASPNIKYSALNRGLFVAVASCLIYALAEQQFYKIETASHSYFLVGLLMAARNVVGSKENIILDKYRKYFRITPA
jgi:O-antigen ligase